LIVKKAILKHMKIIGSHALLLLTRPLKHLITRSSELPSHLRIVSTFLYCLNFHVPPMVIPHTPLSIVWSLEHISRLYGSKCSSLGHRGPHAPLCIALFLLLFLGILKIQGSQSHEHRNNFLEPTKLFKEKLDHILISYQIYYSRLEVLLALPHLLPARWSGKEP
jgi:hypothetical protein